MDCPLNMCWGNPLDAIGDVDGEKEKFCWYGPAEWIIGSLGTLKASIVNGLRPLVVIGWLTLMPLVESSV